MKGKAYTLLILRGSRPEFRKLHVPRGPLLAGTAVLALLLALGLWAPGLWYRVQSQSAKLDRLTVENRQLKAERSRFEEALSAVDRQLGSVEGQARHLATQIGVEALPADVPSGGPTDAAREGGRFWFDGELHALRSRAERVDQSMDRLDDAFRDRVRMLAATPNRLPVEGWFSHGFGWRKDPWTGDREFHKGLDIVAEAGTEILAPADGVVTRAQRWGNYGKCVDVSHGYGFVTRYAHLDRVDVRPGERVSRGDVLGLVGSTGRSTGPHLHYEIFRDGRRVNPWKYLGN